MLYDLDRNSAIAQSTYVKKLRPLLPPEAFTPNPDRLTLIIVNLAILALGWAIADNLDRWNWYYLWLYLPLAAIMGNGIIVLLFSTHDVMHSNNVKSPFLKQVYGLLGLTMLWVPPTFWKAVHNREHHSKTNSISDPDRNYLENQPDSWGKWIQHLFVPSTEVHPIWLIIGTANAWGVHNFRNLTSVLLFNNAKAQYPAAAFKVSSKERRAIALELLIIIVIHASILFYLDFHPLKLLLGYFLPIWIGFSGVMFYIYTNHLLCPMTEVNDPLVNSLSVRVPKFFDFIHLNFSYHTEHHIFPNLNSNYYPMVQALLKEHYGDRYNLLDISEAWQFLLNTPRHYRNAQTLTDWNGKTAIACPCQNNESPN
jgi:fatty acid desaturase